MRKARGCKEGNSDLASCICEFPLLTKEGARGRLRAPVRPQHSWSNLSNLRNRVLTVPDSSTQPSAISFEPKKSWLAPTTQAEVGGVAETAATTVCLRSSGRSRGLFAGWGQRELRLHPLQHTLGQFDGPSVLVRGHFFGETRVARFHSVMCERIRLTDLRRNR